MGRRAAIGTLVVLTIVGVGLWLSRRASMPSPVEARAIERVRPTGCDPLPKTPPLPASLTPSAPTIDGVVQALDKSLTPEHKAYLRCLPAEDELVARTHFGMGRWLRATLHLYRRNPLADSLRASGAKNPDDMSAMIVRAYARSLRGVPMASGVAK